MLPKEEMVVEVRESRPSESHLPRLRGIFRSISLGAGDLKEPSCPRTTQPSSLRRKNPFAARVQTYAIQARDKNTGAIQSIDVAAESTMRDVVTLITRDLAIAKDDLVLVAESKDDCFGLRLSVESARKYQKRRSTQWTAVSSTSSSGAPEMTTTTTANKNNQKNKDQRFVHFNRNNNNKKPLDNNNNSPLDVVVSRGGGGDDDVVQGGLGSLVKKGSLILFHNLRRRGSAASSTTSNNGAAPDTPTSPTNTTTPEAAAAAARSSSSLSLGVQQSQWSLTTTNPDVVFPEDYLYYYRDDRDGSLAEVKPMPWFEFLRHTDLCRMTYDGTANTTFENVSTAARIVENLKVPSTLKKPTEEVLHFVHDACALMREDNRYHNLKHSVDVTQCLYASLVATQLVSRARPLEIAAAIVAAICHDLDHPGYSNAFLNNEGSELSKTYHGESPLENHSVACFRQLAQKHKLLANLDQADAARFDALVETLILSTDMSLHAALMKRAADAIAIADDMADDDADMADDDVESPSSFTSSSSPCFPETPTTLTTDPLASDEGVDLVLSLALKCADISNQARPWKVANAWNVAVYDEFWREGDADRAKGRKVNPLFVRSNKKGDVAQKTVGFIKFVVCPLYETYHRLVAVCATHHPDLSPRLLSECLRVLAANQDAYRLEADGMHVSLESELADRPGICGPQQLRLERQRFERYRRASNGFRRISGSSESASTSGSPSKQDAADTREFPPGVDTATADPPPTSHMTEPPPAPLQEETANPTEEPSSATALTTSRPDLPPPPPPVAPE